MREVISSCLERGSAAGILVLCKAPEEHLPYLTFSDVDCNNLHSVQFTLSPCISFDR